LHLSGNITLFTIRDINTRVIGKDGQLDVRCLAEGGGSS
jgi:hypothetical protein